MAVSVGWRECEIYVPARIANVYGSGVCRLTPGREPNVHCVWGRRAELLVSFKMGRSDEGRSPPSATSFTRLSRHHLQGSTLEREL